MQVVTGYPPVAKQKVLAAWAWTGPKGPDHDSGAFTVVGIEKREPIIFVDGRLKSLSEARAQWGPSVVWSLEDWDWPTGVRELEEKLEEHVQSAIEMERKRVAQGS